MKTYFTNFLVYNLLLLMVINLRFRSKFKKYLKNDPDWINFKLGIRTKDYKVHGGISFHDGRLRASRTVPENADTVLVFSNADVIREMIKLPPNEVLNLLLKNRMYTEGNLTYLNLFNKDGGNPHLYGDAPVAYRLCSFF